VGVFLSFGEEEIPRHYDLEEFNKDLNTLEKLD